MEAVLLFIDGTICDMRHRIPYMETDDFYSDDNIGKDIPTEGSVAFLQELAETYTLVYIGARPACYTETTHKWLLESGFPDGEVYLGQDQQERMQIVRNLKHKYVFAAGIGDRWDDNELHLELDCRSFILQEWKPDWDTVRKYGIKPEPKCRYSQFDAEAVREELLRRYQIETPVVCRLYDYGMNDIYRIKTENKIFYLRISLAGIHTKKDYLEEIHIINTLVQKGIRAAAPVKTKASDGQQEEFVWELHAPEGIRYAVLFTEAPDSPSEDKESCAYNLGCMLAGMHMISDRERFQVSRQPVDMHQLVEKPLTDIRPYLAERLPDYAFLKENAEKLERFIWDRLSKDAPVYGYCHGDVHSGNVFFEGDMPTLFDFDCMGYGWRAYDICIYAWNETFNDENFIDGAIWNKYLEGYESVRKLRPEEKETIPAFAALRELWMMGLHADVMDRNAGCSWYQDDYFDYQIKIFRLWLDRCGL